MIRIRDNSRAHNPVSLRNPKRLSSIKNLKGYPMRINKTYNLGSDENISNHILEGNVEVSCISPFLNNLSFSLTELKNFHEVEPEYIQVDFDRWQKIVDNNKTCLVAFSAMRELKNFAKDDIYFEDNGVLSISFQKEKQGKDKALAVALMMPFGIIEQKERVEAEDKSKVNSGWVLEEGALIATSFGMKIIIEEPLKIKIFSMISEHVNQYIDAVEENVERTLNKYSPFLRLMKVQEHMPIIREIVEEVYKEEAGYYYDENKVGDLMKDVLGMKNIRCI